MPIQYPTIPPITELIVQIKAYHQALSLFAIIIGIKTMSGGIGKKELSIKDMKDKNQVAFG